MKFMLNNVKDVQNLLEISINLAKLMLESGAEIYRVEDSAHRMISSFKNVEDINVFATYTVIIVSICYEGKTYSSMKRIKKRDMDIGRINLLNNFSRKFVEGKYNFENSKKILNDISKTYIFTDFFRSMILTFTGFTFSILYGGDVYSGIGATLAVFFQVIVLKFIKKLKLPFFINSMIGASVVALISTICVFLNISQNLDKMIIGAIMPLVPGMSITNAVRDLMSGDTVSGVSGIINAFLIAVGIAVGVGLILSVYFANLGGIV